MPLEVKLTAVSDEKIIEVAMKLWRDLYEEAFRGKERGRFCLTREQLKEALDTEKLHRSTIDRLQDEALKLGLVIVDLDDLFPCIEKDVVRRYRRPPRDAFIKVFPEVVAEEKPDEQEDE
jgi:hypothetical protein